MKNLRARASAIQSEFESQAELHDEETAARRMTMLREALWTLYPLQIIRSITETQTLPEVSDKQQRDLCKQLFLSDEKLRSPMMLEAILAMAYDTRINTAQDLLALDAAHRSLTVDAYHEIKKLDEDAFADREEEYDMYLEELEIAFPEYSTTLPKKIVIYKELYRLDLKNDANIEIKRREGPPGIA